MLYEIMYQGPKILESESWKHVRGPLFCFSETEDRTNIGTPYKIGIHKKRGPKFSSFWSLRYENSKKVSFEVIQRHPLKAL